jgi:hypothetical protein
MYVYLYPDSGGRVIDSRITNHRIAKNGLGGVVGYHISLTCRMLGSLRVPSSNLG